MQIRTKFNIGDEVFIIRRKVEIYKIDCDTCSGTGKVHIKENDMEIGCPDCHGLGFHHDTYDEFYKESYTIKKIMTETDGDKNTTIMYNIEDEVLDKSFFLEQNYLYSEKDIDKAMKKPEYYVERSIDRMSVSGTLSSTLNQFDSTAVIARADAKIIDINEGKADNKLF
jgi:hypothetical protein